jgi:site-specific DNA-cytosine methylase
MRILELFSGTGSIGNYFATQGWEVVSLDSDPKTEATIKEDILAWDHTVFPPGHFDAIWASPCCTHYSCARRSAKTPRNLELADSLVQRSLEIINYFNPKAWFIENPQTGLLKDRPFMVGICFTDFDYCRFSDWGYRKRTRIWSNIEMEGKLCLGPTGCPNMIARRHKTTAQRGKNKTADGMHGEILSVKQLHRIPPSLCAVFETYARFAVLRAR